MGSINGENKGHVMLLPYPVQGHINPMFQFGKRLVTYGVRVTMAITSFVARNTAHLPPSGATSAQIGVVEISDGYDIGGFASAKSIESYLDDFKAVGSQTLAVAIESQKSKCFPVDCIVYDPFLPWALDVAKELGLLSVAFFTQSCTVDAIYYQAYKGQMPELVPGGPKISIDGVPHLLDVQDIPSFVVDAGPYGGYMKMVLNQFANLDKADAVLFNTIYKLETEVTDWLTKLWPIKTIGPTIPSFYLDKRVIGDYNYGFDLFTRKNCPCIKWLDSKKPASVIYVSFGSLANLGKEEMEELAIGLKNSTKNFLWVVRNSETCKLPENFIEETKETGLVVGWSPQLEVLAHAAVGCFITHCGWNSTLESLCLGVPTIAVPQWTDQPTNAKLMVDMWGVGIRARVDGVKAIVTKEEIESCIREVMDGPKAEAVKKNAAEWRDFAIEAVSDGGSSDKSIKELIDIIVNHKKSS